MFKFGKSYKKIFKNTKLEKVNYANSGKMLFVIGEDVYYKERHNAASYNIKTNELLNRADIPKYVEKIIF